MKRWLLLAIFLLAGVADAVTVSPALRDAARPWLPAAVQGILPADGQSGGKTNPPQTSGGEASTKHAGGEAKNGGVAVISVIATEAERAAVPLVERTFGIMQSPVVVTVNARTSSQITEIHVKDGQAVKSGDVLVTLDDRLLRAQLAKDQAVLLKDKALAADAEVEMTRAKALLAKNAGTQEALDAAVSAQKAADAVIVADQAVVDSDTAQLEYAKIAAPIDGRLGAIQVAVGDVVGSGASGGPSSGQQTSLMTITQMQPLKVTFKLPEGDLPDISKELESGRPVAVRVLKNGTAVVLDSGNLNFIDSSVDTSSGTIAMSATVGNSRHSLWPGQYVNVEIEYGVLADAIVVPAVAVQQGQAGPFVWLVKDDDTAEARPVVVARNEGDTAAISSGLSAGDQVVVEGQLRLKDGAAVKIDGSGGQKQP